MKIRIAHTNPDALTDGPGRRFSIYLQGCLTRCPGCQSPDLWPLTGRREVEVKDLAREALASGLPVSILGGEPFLQPGALEWLLMRLKDARPIRWDREYTVPHVIIYTGYTLEELLKTDNQPEATLGVLRLADMLVDGPFVAALDHDRLQYRGSANQRVIDLRATLGNVHRSGGGPVTPITRDWDTPELLVTPGGDILAAEGLAQQFAALGDAAPARRCGEVR